MTPESEQIDREVAEKVMGWWDEWLHDFDTGMPDHWWTNGDSADYLFEDWSPSTRIDHAWEVVDALLEAGHNVNIFTGSRGLNLVDLMPDWGDTGRFSAESETAPLAICKAALEAVK